MIAFCAWVIFCWSKLEPDPADPPWWPPPADAEDVDTAVEVPDWPCDPWPF
jgi:hypothetical protein